MCGASALPGTLSTTLSKACHLRCSFVYLYRVCYLASPQSNSRVPRSKLLLVRNRSSAGHVCRVNREQENRHTHHARLASHLNIHRLNSLFALRIYVRPHHVAALPSGHSVFPVLAPVVPLWISEPMHLAYATQIHTL